MSEHDPIWRANESGEGSFVADEWLRCSPGQLDAEVPGDVSLLVPLETFLAEPERFREHNGPLGVSVEAGESVEALAPYLARLQLIALAFPKFSDGRAYSSARILRERLGFEGDLRATGDVLSDQIPLMRRCGVTSFAVTHAPTRAALLAGRLPEMRRFYQPVAAAPHEVPAGTRPWLRQEMG